MVETYTPTLMQLTDGAVQKILSLRSNETDSEILNLMRFNISESVSLLLRDKIF